MGTESLAGSLKAAICEAVFGGKHVDMEVSVAADGAATVRSDGRLHLRFGGALYVAFADVRLVSAGTRYFARSVETDLAFEFKCADGSEHTAVFGSAALADGKWRICFRFDAA